MASAGCPSHGVPPECGAWFMDLALAPAVGLAAATYIAGRWRPIYDWGEAHGLESGDVPAWFVIVGPLAFLAFLYGVLGTPMLLAFLACDQPG